MNPREDSPTDPETLTPTVPAARLRQAERERDEARAILSRIKEMIFEDGTQPLNNARDFLPGRLDRMESIRIAADMASDERDEARAEVAQLISSRFDIMRESAQRRAVITEQRAEVARLEAALDEVQRHVTALESELATRDGPLVDQLEALEAERDDLRLQQGELLRAVHKSIAWLRRGAAGRADDGDTAYITLAVARYYCEMDASDRARDAEERAGWAAAADEAALRYG